MTVLQATKLKKKERVGEAGKNLKRVKIIKKICLGKRVIRVMMTV
jgi:hypothetical protein